MADTLMSEPSAHERFSFMLLERVRELESDQRGQLERHHTAT